MPETSSRPAIFFCGHRRLNLAFPYPFAVLLVKFALFVKIVLVVCMEEGGQILTQLDLFESAKTIAPRQNLHFVFYGLYGNVLLDLLVCAMMWLVRCFCHGEHVTPGDKKHFLFRGRGR